MPRIKISQAAAQFNVSIPTVVEQLQKKGITVDGTNPNVRLDEKAYAILQEAFQPDLKEKERIDGARSKGKETAPAAKADNNDDDNLPLTRPSGPRVIGKIELDRHGNPIKPEIKPIEPEKKPEPTVKVEVKVKLEEPVKPEPKPEVKPEPKPEPKPEVKPEPKPEVKPEPKPEVKPEPVKAPEAPKPLSSQPSALSSSLESEAKASDTRAEASASVTATEPKTEPEIFRYNTDTQVTGPKVIGHIDLAALNQSTRPKKKGNDHRRGGAQGAAAGQAGQGGQAGQPGQRKKRQRISGKEKIDIEKAGNQAASSDNNRNQGGNQGGNNQGGQGGRGGRDRGRGGKGNDRNKQARPVHTEVNEEDVQKQVRETLARLTSKDKGQKKGAKWRKEKREAFAAHTREAAEEAAAESKTLQITEFVTVNDLAVMMDVPVNKVIGTCMSLGEMVSINQRLDAETINLVAEEFGFNTEYVSAEVSEAIQQEEDSEDELVTRPPIVTVMGHVDHGKTSLLDYIRSANVIAGEAGGITQHIGAYNVKLADGRHITFLDTPGHEAFTAMRARGAKVTDLVIIIVAADDNVMPQTVEAINHASAAGVPIVFAINKIDKPAANPDKIKEELANMNYLVEDWGGKYQSQDISAKKGIGVEELMEKVLLEAEMLDLKANPDRRATGSIIESSLDKGRGYVATVLVSNGTLRVGDVILAGTHFGKVKAMFNERNQRITEARPAEPALILGLNGAPTAGDTFNVMETEQEAREIASKREQLQRELGLRTSKRTTLEEIGRRRAIGNFHELNIIVKGDVDGSIEALSDSLIKLSTEEVKVNVLHKAVGAISESDVTLAAASDAIIIGFQVRPSQAARRAAEREGVEIRLYSVIYQAIEEVKDAMAGMLAPEIKEEVIGTAEVLQTFRISKVGTIAGVIVREGKIKRGCKVRLIRDGIVRYTGELGSLKRMKDDVKEVTSGYDCGLSIAGYNDIEEGDLIEAFEEVEVKKTL